MRAREDPASRSCVNNAQWGAEKKNHVDYYGNRFVGSNLKNPDFAAIARDMGAEGYRVEKASELQDAVKTAIASGKPSVLNVFVDLGGTEASRSAATRCGNRPVTSSATAT